MKTNWFRKVWPFGIASFACAPALQAQDLPPVLSITLTNVGPQSVSDAAIRAHMRVREGEQYNRRMVADDVENLHKTGYFLNVQVTEAFEEKGVSLVYILQAKPKLTDIVFQGNKKYSNNRLLKSVTSKPGDTLDEKKLFNDVQAIKQKYQKAGYPRTEVKYVTSIDERSGRGSVTFEITESPKVIVKDVSFEGVEGFSQRKLRKQIKTRRHWMFSFITGSGVLKDDVLEEDKDKLTQFFQEEGFIDFEITNIEHDYKNPKHVRLKFELSQGKKYNVGTVEFEGNKLYTTNDLSKAIKMGPGEIFTPKALNKDLEAVRDEYGKQGHIDARVREEKIPNTDTGNMDLKYRIQEGSKSYIEKIEIKGNTKTK
ncbi:MAG: hypothetical protein FJ405_16890, partial [Verrucomicrobia bacterium]|nr:hypothetical protein [Verrucomicrobiota bacterium]